MDSSKTTELIFPEVKDTRWKEKTNKDDYDLHQLLSTYIRVFDSKEGRYYLISVRRRLTYCSNTQPDYSGPYNTFIRDCYMTQILTDFSFKNKLFDGGGFSPFILDKNQEPEHIRLKKTLPKPITIK